MRVTTTERRFKFSSDSSEIRHLGLTPSRRTELERVATRLRLSLRRLTRPVRVSAALLSVSSLSAFSATTISLRRKHV